MKSYNRPQCAAQKPSGSPRRHTVTAPLAEAAPAAEDAAGGGAEADDEEEEYAQPHARHVGAERERDAREPRDEGRGGERGEREVLVRAAAFQKKEARTDAPRGHASMAAGAPGAAAGGGRVGGSSRPAGGGAPRAEEHGLAQRVGLDEQRRPGEAAARVARGLTKRRRPAWRTAQDQ